MEENNPGKSALCAAATDAFISYAGSRPAQTASIIERIIKSSSGEEEEIDVFGIRMAAVLLLSLPDDLASEVVARSRLLTDEGREPVIERLIFEMARLEAYDPFLFADALCEFMKREAAEPLGGIDRARAILEKVYPTERLVGMINHLTEMLIEQNSEVPGDVQ